MGLFDKKYCDFCKEKIGLLGNRKLTDGNMCKSCASKLSPWFSERKQSSVADIREQLAYREANQAEVDALHVTRTLGKNTKVMLDEDNQKFVVTAASNWRAANPDVLNFSDVTGCDVDVSESHREQMREIKQKDGTTKRVSHVPPQYIYSYDFNIRIQVNNPYFSEIKFRLNSSIEIHQTGRTAPGNPAALNIEYKECQDSANEIKRALTQVRTQVRREAAAAARPKAAVTCACCGATTTPDASGCCEYCGGPVNG